MEDECYFCGVSKEKEQLYDAISNRELVKICDKCSLLQGIPVINKPSHNQLKEADRPHTVYERLYKMAGLHTYNKELEDKKRKEDTELRKKEFELAQIMEQNLKEKSIGVKQKDDLVDNFHWDIMRARRNKGLSQKQLGEEIGESEITIRMAEKAILPKEYMVLIEKIENKLGVPLKKNSQIKKPSNPASSKIVLDFDSRSFPDVKIGDLKKAKEDDSDNFVEEDNKEE